MSQKELDAFARFVMQLEVTPADLRSRFDAIVRKMFPGPVSWATSDDLCNLQTWFGFPAQIDNPVSVALAAKLRVIAYVAPNCMARSRELAFLHLEYGRRPFPDWHNRAYVRVLADVEKLLADNGISVEKVQKMCLK